MTASQPSRDDDARTDSPGEDAGRTRRGLLRSGTAVALALASAGCLSNPWRPGATRRETEPSGGGADPATATSASGGDEQSDGSTATDATSGDGTTTEPEATTEASTTGSETTTEASTTAVPAAEKEPDLVVEVAPDGFMFSPETFEISAGDTVHWEWKDSGHNVRVKAKPDESEWTGTPGDATDTYGEGYLHAHTFEASGEYEYYCAPHRSLGLRGSFDVR